MLAESCQLICGIDEAGRGPLIGNVVAGAVILDDKKPIFGLQDSKKLSAAKRNQLYELIIQNSLAWGVGQASPAEIDRLNILEATMLAMQRALDHLMKQFMIRPNLVLVDGNRCPDIAVPSQAMIHGDASTPVISAASILAKVTRDRQMAALDQEYPLYGFKDHQGYPTKRHLEMIHQLGLIPGYRLTFGPIKKLLL